jgi:hypothetical protein
MMRQYKVSSSLKLSTCVIINETTTTKKNVGKQHSTLRRRTIIRQCYRYDWRREHPATMGDVRIQLAVTSWVDKANAQLMD